MDPPGDIKERKRGRGNKNKKERKKRARNPEWKIKKIIFPDKVVYKKVGTVLRNVS